MRTISRFYDRYLSKIIMPAIFVVLFHMLLRVLNMENNVQSNTTNAAESKEVVVKLSKICKSFNGVPALVDVDFELRKGEVLALLGENGAGKSTLMKILSGIYTRDSGQMQIFGKDIKVQTGDLARELGIAIIHQELNMCQHLTVAENIFLGREKVSAGGFWVRQKEMNAAAKEVLDHLNVDFPPTAITSTLSVAKQQIVEIAKALSCNARILIMDEPTSALTSNEIADLFNMIRRLKSEGVSIVYISHRLEELKHIVDRVSIMRDGHYITSMDFDENKMDQIIAHMVGREITDRFPRVECEVGETLFEVKNLNAGRMVRNVSLNVRRGEILGIAGLMGAGRTETTRAIFGVDPKESGQIIVNGQEVKINSVSDAIKAGIVLAPEDRKRDGLCTKLPIRENIGLPNLDWLSQALGIVNRKQEMDTVGKEVKDLAIKVSNVDNDAASLSGGNQQKVVIGKWLARDSKVVIFDEPTRGVDVAAKVEIYNIMNKLKQEGVAVMFVSSELPEVLGIADRIIVMCDGRVTGELMAKEATQEKVMKLATTFEDKFSQESAEA